MHSLAVLYERYWASATRIAFDTNQSVQNKFIESARDSDLMGVCRTYIALAINDFLSPYHSFFTFAKKEYSKAEIVVFRYSDSREVAFSCRVSFLLSQAV